MNVTSTAFVGKYLETGMPLTTKRLTVDGDIVKEPKNVEVIIGTPIQELLDFCGGLTAQPGKVLYGGPMMAPVWPVWISHSEEQQRRSGLFRGVGPSAQEDQLHPLRPVCQRLSPGSGGQGHCQGL